MRLLELIELIKKLLKKETVPLSFEEQCKKDVADKTKKFPIKKIKIQSTAYPNIEWLKNKK